MKVNLLLVGDDNQCFIDVFSLWITLIYHVILTEAFYNFN